jgi:hypothetical protein
MASIRPLLLAVACTLPLSAIACGGGDDAITPEGMHYGYVVSKASVPPSMAQASMYGLDIGAAKSDTPDGLVDNRLGETLGILAGMGFAIQATIDEAINVGSIILLVDFQTTDFTNAKAAGLSVKLGANPMPAACSSPTDTTCANHLKGTASFSIAANSPMDAAVAGKIVNGTFTGGPGDITLQIALGTTQPLTLGLLNARAKATAITDAGMTLTVGGMVTATELMTQVLPAIQVQVAAVISRDCGTTGTPPTCGCTSTTSTGATLLGLFDGDITGTVDDCHVSVEEIAGHPLIQGLLAPDVCSMSSCSAPDSLSLGIQVQTVKATFPM